MATTAPRKTAPQAPQKAAGAAQAARPTPAPTPAGGAVVARQNMAVALPADLMAELGAAAKDQAAKERPSVSKLSIRSGILSYQQNPVPGNNMDVIIVGNSYRNVYYSGPFDPDTPANPDCFALSESGDQMEPHENVTEPEHTTCEGCPKAEWGSALRNGKPSRGKACKETRRLIVLPANVLNEEDPEEAVLKAELAILDLPVTSVRNWANLVNTLAATINMPVWAVRTNVQVSPHPRNQFEVGFTPLSAAGDEKVIRALMKRRDEALRIALLPYEGAGGEADPEAAKPATPAKPAAKRKF